VVAFLYADLTVIPILLIHRKYYGTKFAVRITALMLITMVIAALVVDEIFSGPGLIPTGPRPTHAHIFGSVEFNYKLALNVLGIAIFAAMFWLTSRPGATDPACGMKVDRAGAVTKELDGRTYYFCSGHAWTFEAAASSARHAVPARARGREMSARGNQLDATADRQIAELLGLIATVDEEPRVAHVPTPSTARVGTTRR
jgi:YHS domain-containing protein